MGGEDIRMGAADAASALGWWLEAGVDVAVAEEPRNWLEVRSPAPPNVRPPSAQAVSQALETLHLFRDWLGTAPSLPLGDAGATRVLPQGEEAAPVMLVAEMPAQEDAAEGRPIGGEAWRLMAKMLAAIGIRAEDAYSATLSCFHAPGAKMRAEELAECADIAAGISLSPSRSACSCSATRRPGPCWASRWPLPAAMFTKSKASVR